MDNSILFKDGPALVQCEECGGYYEPEDFKKCRICGRMFCPECQKTHDCRVKPENHDSASQIINEVYIDKRIEQNTENTPELAVDELKCDGCGKVYNKSELRKCHKCGAVLCSSCRETHRCSKKKEAVQTAPLELSVIGSQCAPSVNKIVERDVSEPADNPIQNSAVPQINVLYPESGKKKELPITSKGTVVTGQKSVGLAVFLGFLIPGLGLMYAGQVGKGVLFLLLSLFLCITIITPLLCWILGMVFAAKLCKENNLLWLDYIRN